MGRSGWRLEGTDRWWPSMFGPPPSVPGLSWVPLPTPSEPPVGASGEHTPRGLSEGSQ